MNLRKFRRESPAIDLTPLIDVVFMLLIFFMVSTTFKDQSLIRIDLPKASPQQQEKNEQTIMLSVDAQGDYFVNGKQVVNNQLDTLKKALQLAIGGRDHPPLTISADGKTPHQAVVTAMDAARQVGLVHLSIATRTTPDAGH